MQHESPSPRLSFETGVRVAQNVYDGDRRGQSVYWFLLRGVWKYDLERKHGIPGKIFEGIVSTWYLQGPNG